MNNKIELIDQLFKHIKIDCSKCFGLCCVALYFSKLDGFPANKVAGSPCKHLQSDFGCDIHSELRNKGLKGCTSYDCFGAGQKIAQITYRGKSWISSPKLAKQMYEAFLVMRQLHEMLWYLTEAVTLENIVSIKESLQSMIEEIKQMTLLKPEAILKIDIESHRTQVNILLKEAYKLNRQDKKSIQKTSFEKMLIGKDLRKANLKEADLSGAMMIAANLKECDLSGALLIGVDMRDADIICSNLSKSIFLTQAQINTAKGNQFTKLPSRLDRPSYWEK